MVIQKRTNAKRKAEEEGDRVGRIILRIGMKKWWLEAESNRRPPGYESGALTN
jgi:hypothetical protein